MRFIVSVLWQSIVGFSHKSAYPASQRSVKSCRGCLPIVRLWAVGQWRFGYIRPQGGGRLLSPVVRQPRRGTRRGTAARKRDHGSSRSRFLFEGCQCSEHVWKLTASAKGQSAHNHSANEREDIRFAPSPKLLELGRLFLRCLRQFEESGLNVHHAFFKQFVGCHSSLRKVE